MRTRAVTMKSIAQGGISHSALATDQQIELCDATGTPGQQCQIQQILHQWIHLAHGD